MGTFRTPWRQHLSSSEKTAGESGCIHICNKGSRRPEHQRLFSGEEDPDTGKDGGQEKGTTEDEMGGWHRRLDGHEAEQIPGVGDGWRKPGVLWSTGLHGVRTE